MRNRKLAKHFEVSNDQEWATCKICRKCLKYQGTTTSLIYHVTHVHRISLKEEGSESCNQALDDPVDTSDCSETNSIISLDSSSHSLKPMATSFLKNVEHENMPPKRVFKNTLKPQTVGVINEALFKMIAQDMLPLSFTEKDGFKNFLNIALPGYNPPGREEVTHQMQLLYEESSLKLRNILKRFKNFSLTIDGWTSTSDVSYITVTAHFIDDNWELRTYVLDTFDHPEENTEDNLRKSVEDCITRWNMKGKILATVHDNARNVTASVRDSLQLGESVPCFAHTLQLSVNSALEYYKETIRKAIHLVGHLRHSANLNLPELKLDQSCVTRWNSTFKMLKRLLEQRTVICEVLEYSTSAGTSSLYLNNDDWDSINQLVEVLEAFEITTTLMSSASKVTLSMVRPLLFRLKANFLLKKVSDSERMKKFKECAARELQERFIHKTSTVNGEPSCTILAEILDPRYKNLSVESDNLRSAVTGKLSRLLECNNVEDELETPPSTEQLALNFLFYGSKVSQECNGCTKFEEFEKYMSEAESPLHTNPLTWWRENNSRYPNLAKIAKQYLCIPATSVPSERVFSTAGDIITSERSRLLSENANFLIFLAENKSLYLN